MKKWYDDLKRGDRAAHIYKSDGEQSRAIIDLIAWLEDGEKLVLLSDRWDSDKKPLRSRVIDAAIEDGHLDIIPVKASLTSTGKFRAEALADMIDLEFSKAMDEGHTGTVVAWDLDWLAACPEDFNAHIVQQTNLMVSPTPRDLTLFGQYGLGSYTADQVERLHRVNPLVLEDGTLSRNFWVVSTTAIGRPPRDVRSFKSHMYLEGALVK